MGDSDNEFLPLTRVIPKELLPLTEEPLIQRPVKEALDCGAREVDFILPSGRKKEVVEHFKREEDSLASFSYLSTKKNSKNNQLFSRLKGKIADDVFILASSDVIFQGKDSATKQLFSVHRTSQKPVVALREVSDEEMSDSIIVETERIASRLYKIKEVLENPAPEDTDSRLALSHKYILTPSLFDHLEDAEDVLTSVVRALDGLIDAGKTVYGHECEGEWYHITDKSSYINTLKTFLN